MKQFLLFICIFPAINVSSDVRRYRTEDEKHDPAKRDTNIGWEQSGMAGKIWFYYKADTVNHKLYLQNKNRVDRDQRQVLHYSRPSSDRIILNGVNEFKDSVYVVLDRVNRVYPLHSERHNTLSKSTAYKVHLAPHLLKHASILLCIK